MLQLKIEFMPGLQHVIANFDSIFKDLDLKKNLKIALVESCKINYH